MNLQPLDQITKLNFHKLLSVIINKCDLLTELLRVLVSWFQTTFESKNSLSSWCKCRDSHFLLFLHALKKNHNYFTPRGSERFCPLYKCMFLNMHIQYRAKNVWQLKASRVIVIISLPIRSQSTENIYMHLTVLLGMHMWVCTSI